MSKNQENSFFNKMKPYYYKEYFSEKAIKYFKKKVSTCFRSHGLL